MQFILTAQDKTDEGAFQRRLDVRQSHIELGDKLRDEGKLLFAAGHIDESGKLCGSTMIFDVSSREELEFLLKQEPYLLNNVWDGIKLTPCKVGPSFAVLTKEKS